MQVLLNSEAEDPIDCSGQLFTPSFQKDTISSFTSRAITRSIPKKPYDHRGEDVIYKRCKIPIMRQYLDPVENRVRTRTPKEDRRLEKTRSIAHAMMARTLDVSHQPDSNPLQTRALFQEFGKTTKFTDSFNNLMYQDNSLWAASRLQKRLNQGHQLRDSKRERERAKLQSIIDRRALAALYKEKHGIRIDNHEVERLTEK